MYKFIKTINSTTLYGAAVEAAKRVATQIVAARVAPAFPREDRDNMVAVMNVIESGEIEEALTNLFLEVGFKVQQNGLHTKCDNIHKYVKKKRKFPSL